MLWNILSNPSSPSSPFHSLAPCSPPTTLASSRIHSGWMGVAGLHCFFEKRDKIRENSENLEVRSDNVQICFADEDGFFLATGIWKIFLNISRCVCIGPKIGGTPGDEWNKTTRRTWYSVSVPAPRQHLNPFFPSQPPYLLFSLPPIYANDLTHSKYPALPHIGPPPQGVVREAQQKYKV